MPTPDGGTRLLAEDGQWPGNLAPVLQRLRRMYLYGLGDAAGDYVESFGVLFGFLQAVAFGSNKAQAMLSVDMVRLAEAMLPAVKGSRVAERRTNIQNNLPSILDELAKRNLAQTDMILFALATIAAENAMFVPNDEDVASTNTAGYRSAPDKHHPRGQFVPTGAPFALYDNRGQGSLGNLGSPDGASFRGRGFDQTTGRYNYTVLSKELGLHDQLILHPEMASDPKIAAAMLAQYMKDREPLIRDALKRNNLRDERRIINGGLNGYDVFRDAFNRGRRFVGESIIQDAQAAARNRKHAKPTTPGYVAPHGHHHRGATPGLR